MSLILWNFRKFAFNTVRILYHVHILLEHDAVAAGEALDHFLTLRLHDENEQWVQRTLVTRIWIAVEKTTDSRVAIDSLRQMLGVAASRLSQPLPANAAHAAQIVSIL